MKVKIEADALAEALKVIKPAIGNNGALSCVHIVANDDEAVLTGTNATLAISTTVSAVGMSNGVALVPYAPLAGAVGSVQGAVEIVEGEQVVDVDGGGMHLTLRQPTSDYWPNIFDTPGTQVEISQDRIWHLKKLLPFGKPSQSHPQLAGVRFEGHHAMATDATALAAVFMGDTDFPGATVPLASMAAVLQAAEDLSCSFSENRASFTSGNTTWITQLVEGKYPTMFLEKLKLNNPKTMTVQRDDLVSALNITGSVQPELAISIVPSTDVVEFKSSSDYGGASHAIPFVGDMDWEFRINPKYIKEVLPAVRGDEFTLSAEAPLNPILVGEGDFTGLIMPIR